MMSDTGADVTRTLYLRFTVDLPALFVECARMLPPTGGAGGGLITGLICAQQYIMEIAQLAAEEENVPILLRMFAIGFIANPVQALKDEGLWRDSYDAYAYSISALKE